MTGIGIRIKLKREQLGISQEELANKLGYKSRSSINKIENGENDIPLSKVNIFAKSLYTTPAYLLGMGDSTFSERIKTQRLLESMTIEEIAKELNLIEKDYVEIENINQYIIKLTINTLEELSKIIKIKPYQLLLMTEGEYKNVYKDNDPNSIIEILNYDSDRINYYDLIYALNKYMDENNLLKISLLEKETEKIKVIEKELCVEEEMIIKNYRKLNKDGKNEALKRIEEFTLIDKYLDKN